MITILHKQINNNTRKDYIVQCEFRHFIADVLNGRTVKALANHFGGPGSIPSTGCSESELDREIFAPVPEAALNVCELHVKPYFNF